MDPWSTDYDVVGKRRLKDRELCHVAVRICAQWKLDAYHSGNTLPWKSIRGTRNPLTYSAIKPILTRVSILDMTYLCFS